MIQRTLSKPIQESIRPGRAVLLFGARRVGKTVLIKELLKRQRGSTLFLNGEDSNVVQMLSNRTSANYRGLFDGISTLAIDEAQAVPEVGKVLKLIVDEVPHTSVIASGSSSFDLLRKAGEPLVGRARQFTLFPFSQTEISQIETPFDTPAHLEQRLIYGSYPDVVLESSFEEKGEYLRELVNSYLLKDILAIDGLKYSGKLLQLLRLVAYQTGSEVSYDELGKQIGMSKNTVEKYLGLLEQVFVIYRLGSFSRNLRNEVARAGKWYFTDTGIRNALIGNFQPLANRSDQGALWENYLISERIKRQNNALSHPNHYFWRTYGQKEIDLIEETTEGLRAFEFKWGHKHPNVPADFASAYPNASFTVIDRENYIPDFIAP